jgi:hypothetical protein
LRVNPYAEEIGLKKNYDQALRDLEPTTSKTVKNENKFYPSLNSFENGHFA